jgi:hypothetical protein
LRFPIISRLIHGYLAQRAILSQLHERGIDANPHQPCRKPRSSVEAFEVRQRTYEGFLYRILCVFAVSGDPQGRVESFVVMTASEFPNAARSPIFAAATR